MKRLLLSALSLALCAGLLVLPASAQRLANLSTRTPVGGGNGVAVVGFVVGQGSNKNILIRAVGPTLATSPYNVPGTISDPRIDIADATGRVIFTNDNWGSTTGSPALAAAATAVGAFSLVNNSRDAAILATNLAPGAYTATVGGVGTASGVGLVEVYDVSGTARLMNLSTRAQVGTGSGIIISGLVIAPGDGRRQILVRAIGPALTGFGVAGALADPVISIVNNSAPTVQIAANDNWSATTAAVASLKAAFTQSGAFPLTEGSKDAAVITDLAPGSYSIQVSGANNTTGQALVEVYDITPETLSTVAVVATNPTTDTKGAAPGVYTFTRTGATAAPLTAYYQVSGTATPGVDYAALSGSVTFAPGVSTVTVNLNAQAAGGDDAISRSATVTLAPGSGYALAAANVASVTILYNPGTNYIAALRTTPTATASTAFGTATIQLSGDSTFAVVNVTFSGLSSPETVAYLRLGNPGEVGTEVLRLAPGQVTGQRWTFPTEGALTTAAIVQAIKDGRIFLSIESSSYPSGELRGTFIQNNATLAFTPPAAPPTLADTPMTAAEASRFLAQATFGPKKSEIDELAGKRPSELAAWITAQMALPASSHDVAADEDFAIFTKPNGGAYSYQNRQAAWWKLSVQAPDQLRQRVAFALSEIFVVSDQNGTLFAQSPAMSVYYDLFVNGAFGTYRDLIEKVSLSPVMGLYLSSLRNAKATFDGRTGAVLTSPDENYAREVMQLFSIGLNQLQPDGTLKLDPVGVPIPTYDQKTITEVAKIFTGWAFASDTTNVNNFRGAGPNYILPMVLFPSFHEDGAKTIFNGIQIAANQGGARDLADFLDALNNHPNTGPFISRQLIQRLVTSNPSPGYVYRVAQVFANDGAGVRGNLGAVVRAILTDYEARSPAVAATASFGKLKEPLIRATAILRAFNGGSNVGRYQHFVGQGAESALGQTPLHAPTVFNFFEPNYVQPGALAAAGLYAPEYQILNDTTAISAPNQLWNFIYANRSATNAFDTTLGIQLDSLLPLARTPAALVDQVNLILTGGGLSKAVTDRFTAALTAMPVGTGATFTTANDIERVRSAIYLTVSVPQGAVQK